MQSEPAGEAARVALAPLCNKMKLPARAFLLSLFVLPLPAIAAIWLCFQDAPSVVRRLPVPFAVGDYLLREGLRRMVAPDRGDLAADIVKGARDARCIATAVRLEATVVCAMRNPRPLGS